MGKYVETYCICGGSEVCVTVQNNYQYEVKRQAQLLAAQQSGHFHTGL